MTKPTSYISSKKGNTGIHQYVCHRSLRLKMKDEEVVNKLFDITKHWENIKKVRFIGKSFNTVRKENYSGQDMFLLSPLWLNYIISECGELPNKYSYNAAINRINKIKLYDKIPIQNKDAFNILFKEKQLAAGAFIVSMDMEFRGIQMGRPSLCMSERYKDFLEFMFVLGKKWGWINHDYLSSVSVEYNRKIGINASPQYEFRVSTKGLAEIYELAGPLSNSSKDNCIKFNINRSKNYINLGGRNRYNGTREKIIQALMEDKDLTTTKLQFKAGVGTDVILDHLNVLFKSGKITKERKGKKYIWNIKNGNERRE